MEFIGIGVKPSDAVNFEQIRDKASNHDLLASKTITEGPFRQGLENFSSHLEVSLFQFSAFNEDDKKASSRQISTELMAFHDQLNDIGFLNFFIAERVVLPKSFYLIFACDWAEAGPVRLEKIAIKDLKPYFKRNNSWYLWLYNYSAKRFYPKLDLPLILEITND